MPATPSAIEVRVGELRQLFHSIDPSPFHERDLDPEAESFIVGWARDHPSDAQLTLVVHLERAAPEAREADLLRDAVHEFFARRAHESRRALRTLFKSGRTSLLIAIAFLALMISVGDALAGYFSGRLAETIREGLLIGGWVAMWRPLQIFLYEWWPIRAEVRLFERLSTMPVSVRHRPT